MEGVAAPTNGTVLDVVAPLITELAGEVDRETCKLLGPFALIIQLVLGLGVLGSLLLKRMREKPRRKWKIWFGDIGKQLIGQGFVHSSNVLISDVIAKHKSDNPCSLYFLNIAVDTTVGVLILWVFIRLSTLLLLHYSPTYRTGDYGDPPSFKIWAKQCAVYVGCLSAMKGVVIGLFWAFPWLFTFANWCLSWLKSDESQVLFVMLISPLFFNILQFLLIDAMLKSKPLLDSPFLGSTEDDEEARRGFLEDDDDTESENGDSKISTKKIGADDAERGRVVPVPSPGNSSVHTNTNTNTNSFVGSPNGRIVARPFTIASEEDEEGEEDSDPTPRAGTPSHSYPPVLPPPSSTTPTRTNHAHRMSYGSTREPKVSSISPPPPPPPPRWDEEEDALQVDEKVMSGLGLGLGDGALSIAEVRT